MSLEATLAAVLQAEVDKRVAAVQAAADVVVQAFRLQAEGIARGEVAAHAPPAHVPGPRAFTPPTEPVEDLPAHMRPPADEALPSRSVTDAHAVSANMSAYR